MSNLSIKGQECVLIIMKDGEPQLRIDSIKDAEVTFDLEIITEGYLGETTNRRDMIFNGMGIKGTGHMTNQYLLLLADSIAARAQRREGAAVQIDMSLTLLFPAGIAVSIVVPDVQFQSIPITIGGREEYASWSLEAEGSEYDLVI